MPDYPIGFALHQEKRGDEFRRIVIAPPGYTLAEFDAAGQEFRWMAILSGDPTMLALCEDGEDAHSYMGASIYREDYRTIQQGAGVKGSHEEHVRKTGKFANLSLQYRTGERKLLAKARVDYGMNMKLDEARLIRRVYFQTYRKVPESYWPSQIQKVKRLHYAETLAGRRVSVVGDWGGKQGWSMESTAINYPVQGTGADQKYLALAVIRDYLREVGGRFTYELHDGLFFLLRNETAQRDAIEIKRRLDDLPYKKAWGFKPPVPLPWDCKLGPSWGQLKGLKT